MKKTINEREFELINIVGVRLGATQRELSEELNLSLGMTNMLLHRMIAKGYIRIQQLNQRKVQYILTPKGFTEKIRKSIKYIQKTMQSMNFIKAHVEKTVAGLINQGECHFKVLGTSDLAMLVGMTINEHGSKHLRVEYVSEFPHGDFKGTLFVCQEHAGRNSLGAYRVVNIVEELVNEQDKIRGEYVG